MRPFRFIASLPRWDGDLSSWRASVRRIADLGFDTVAVSDHLSGGWALDPFVSLQAAADAAPSLRLLTLVLNNDFRHPAVLHKAAANLDVFSGGRLELGLGAGWMAADYEGTGLTMDPAPVRVERLAETVGVLKELFAGGTVDHDGPHLRLHGLMGVPSPTQTPRPPLLIGGGGPRVLDLAAREADIVGVHAGLRSGQLDASAVADLSAESVAAKVARVRSTAIAAGRDPDGLELQFSVYHCQVGTVGPPGPRASSFARFLDASPDLLNCSPAVLRGSVDECVDLLVQRREEYGLSYLNLGTDVAAVAPVVARLAGC